ncbi:MAG: hypothetical protein ACHQ7M_09465 [Chloroflexota bacterium]
MDTPAQPSAIDTRNPSLVNPHYDKVPAGWFSEEYLAGSAGDAKTTYTTSPASGNAGPADLKAN